MLIAVGLAGCTSDSAPVSSPSKSPVRPSAQAVAEARAVYEKYVQVSSDVSQADGKGADRLHELLTDEAFDRDLKSIQDVADAGLHSEGRPRLVAFKAQSVRLSSGEISAYACLDFSDVRVKNQAGKDVTPADRPTRQTSNPSFVTQAGRTLIAEDKPWSGESIC